MLTDLFGFRMMSQEHNLDLFVLPAQEAGHPEKKAARAVFFEGPHRSGGIHHSNDDCIGMRDGNIIPCFVTQIIGTDAVDAGISVAGVAPQILQ